MHIDYYKRGDNKVTYKLELGRQIKWLIHTEALCIDDVRGLLVCIVITTFLSRVLPSFLKVSAFII